MSYKKIEKITYNPVAGDKNAKRLRDYQNLKWQHEITGRVCSLENNSHPPVKLVKKIDNLERKVDELLHLLRKSRA